MKCSCGGKIKVADSRGNDYVIYRLRKCPICGKEFITKETRIDYKEGKKMLIKIHTAKYQEIKPTKKRRRKRE